MTNLVNKIKEFDVDTKPETVEKFMNQDGVIDPVLHIGHKDTVERHQSYLICRAGSSSEDDTYAYNHVAVRKPIYIVHYKQKMEE